MSKVVIFSGAGLSASSGISTFREADGLWENHKIEEVCQAGCLDTYRDKSVNFYNMRRAELQDKKPNLAHEVLSRLEKEYPNEVTLITQNVDNLLEQAGAKNVLHLHGFLTQIRCMECEEVYDIGYMPQDEAMSECPKCGGALRPNIVFFGEAAPKYQDMHEILSGCELLVIIGTSGAVIDVNMLRQYADYAILNNLEKSEYIVEEIFDTIYYDEAPNVIKQIEEQIVQYIDKGLL